MRMAVNSHARKIELPHYYASLKLLYYIIIYLKSVYYRNLTCFNRWQLYVSYQFNVSQCDKSLSAGFNPIKTWQQRAAMPLQPAQGHRLQVQIYRRFFLWRNDRTISITIKYAPLSYRIGGNRKRSEQSINAVHKSLETVFSIAL